MLPPKPIGVGIIGATGFIGSAYRAEIRETVTGRLIALAARRTELLDKAARQDRVRVATTDWRAVVRHPEVDLVIIATPDSLHREAALCCAEAQKHVLCEKPVGFDSREAQEILSAFRTRPELAHFVPFWLRCLAIFRRARTLVHAGAVGDVRSVIYRWFDPRPWKMLFTWRDDPDLSAGGSIADVGSHAYDLIRWILSEDANRVLAHAATISPARHDVGPVNLSEALAWPGLSEGPAAKRRKGGTPDYASISWTMESGIIGNLLVSHAPHLRKGLAPDLEIHGTKATLGVHRVTGNLVLVRTDGKPEIIETHPEVFGNRFEQFVFPAVNAVRTGQTSDHPDLQDGYHVQRFTDAATRAAAVGGWVKIE